MHHQYFDTFESNDPELNQDQFSLCHSLSPAHGLEESSLSKLHYDKEILSQDHLFNSFLMDDTDSNGFLFPHELFLNQSNDYPSLYSSESLMMRENNVLDLSLSGRNTSIDKLVNDSIQSSSSTESFSHYPDPLLTHSGPSYIFSSPGPSFDSMDSLAHRKTQSSGSSCFNPNVSDNTPNKKMSSVNGNENQRKKKLVFQDPFIGSSPMHPSKSLSLKNYNHIPVSSNSQYVEPSYISSLNPTFLSTKLSNDHESINLSSKLPIANISKDWTEPSTLTANSSLSSQSSLHNPSRK